MEYQVVANVTISVYTKVEANSEEEALKIAEERSLMSISTNNGDDENEVWMADELDGTPVNLRIED